MNRFGACIGATVSLIIVACGSGSSDHGFSSDSNDGPDGGNVRSAADGGEDTVAQPSNDSGALDASSHSGADGSAFPIDAATIDGGVALGNHCIVNTPANPPPPGMPQTLTLSGTITETAPLAGTPQPFTVTVTGGHVLDGWEYDELSTSVDITSSLFPTLGTAADSYLVLGVGGAMLYNSAGAEDALCGREEGIDLTAAAQSTQFTGTYCNAGITYSISVTAPASVLPCAAVPDCIEGESFPSDYCGSSIDGFSNVLYHCATATSIAEVLQTCPSPKTCLVANPSDACQ